jgi:hypothetical protein
MADIFLSYNEKDRDAVRRLAERLQSTGWSVWWDRRIPAGLTWRSVLERELRHMRCMVVLWSRHSVASDWVCEEAAEGRQLGRLVPVLIEHVRPPAGFREIQAADLVDWDGSPDFLGLRRLLEDIEGLIGKPGAETGSAPEPGPAEDAPTRATATPPQPFPWGMSALLVAIAVGAYYGTVARRSPEVRSDPPQSPVKTTVPASRPMPVDAASASLSAAAAPASTPTMRAAAASQPAASRPAPSASSIMARCGALRERLALGETLSSTSQVFFRQECSK